MTKIHQRQEAKFGQLHYFLNITFSLIITTFGLVANKTKFEPTHLLAGICLSVPAVDRNQSFTARFKKVSLSQLIMIN